ncbi:MAG: tetratricopeptide repeat protein [Bryobacteraceae bacterium]|nr:tetratricopeptide repeat protein [Bryobacteraceae bacterium]MDW8378876.1 tetratricopeptide repeat protein [Bryobacterales bacterium]
MNLKLFTATVSFLGALTAAFGQPATAEKKVDKAAAYYNFSMGHLYSELAGQFNNRAEYLNKAIDHYRAALKADPSATFIVEELAELQMRSGRIREAVLEAEEGLKQNPDDLNLRRLLGFIYTRLIGDAQQNRINEEMLKKAIEQYQRITEKNPKDLGAWLLLGRLFKVAQNSPESERAYKKALELDGNNEEALTGLAMVYADVGDTKSAAELLKKVSEKSPSVRVFVALAAAYEQLRDYQSAASTLRKALELSPNNQEIKRGLAQNLLLADKLDESLELFQQLAAEEPRDPLPHLRMSQIYRQKRDFEKAHAAAKKAAELDPNSLEIRYNEVNLLEAEGKTSEAIEALRLILATTSKRNYNPGERNNRIILLERLGYLHRTIEQYPQAVEAFKQIQQLDEDQAARAWVHIIETYRQARDIPKAFEEARAAREKFPKDRAVLSMYAFIAADSGKRDEAEKLAKELISAKKDRETWISVAQIYERTKNYTEMGKALDEAEKLSEEKEEKEGIHFMRGAMYEKMKKIDLAEAEFRKLLELNPNHSSALNYLGYMLVDRNMKVNEAYEMIKKAVDQEPNNGAYLDSLGWALFRLNRLEEAETYLKRALERTPKDPTIHDHLGDVYAKQGKIKEAILMWQRSLQEWEATPVSEQDATEIAKIQKKLDSAKVRLAKENGQKK